MGVGGGGRRERLGGSIHKECSYVILVVKDIVCATATHRHHGYHQTVCHLCLLPSNQILTNSDTSGDSGYKSIDCVLIVGCSANLLLRAGLVHVYMRFNATLIAVTPLKVHGN